MKQELSSGRLFGCLAIGIAQFVAQHRMVRRDSFLERPWRAFAGAGDCTRN
jgi:hypothetical protein